jgi:gluconolactonase
MINISLFGIHHRGRNDVFGSENMARFLAAIVILAGLVNPGAAQSPKAKILFLGKDPDHPYGSHMYMHTCKVLAKCAELTPGVETVVSNGWPKNTKTLDGVKTIVIYTSPAAELLLEGPHRQQVDEFMKKGVGLVTIHWASAVKKDDFGRLGPTWLSYLGGTWVSNVGLSEGRSPLKQLIPEHPICRGWKEFEIEDEYYLNPTIKLAKPLLQVTERKGKDVIVGWVFERPNGGRAFGTTLGHPYANFQREPFRRLIVNAILWSARVEVPKQGAPVHLKEADLALPPKDAASPAVPQSKTDIVPPGAKLEKIFGDGVVLTEGVAAAPDGTVYFSDITFSHVARDKKGAIEAGHIWKHDPKTGKTTIFRSPSGMSNGIKFDADGNMIVAEGADFGGRRVIRTDMKTGKSYIIAALFEGRPFNSPNDIAIDEKGRIYFSDPRYLGHEPIEQPVQAVYRIDPDGSIHRIITDAGKPNGVCVSPDQQTLYVVSNDNGHTGIGRLPADAPVHKGQMALLAYSLAPDGSAKFRKVLVDYAPQDGPDGLVCDAEGNVYVAVRDETRPGIYVYSPQGKELAYIKTELPTNVGFGRGQESSTLYITAGKSVYRIRLNKKGYQLPAK